MPMPASPTSGPRCATSRAWRAEVDLWTACYTPRELRLLARLAGLRVDAISAVEPGAYGDAPPDTEHAELLVLATRP